MASIDGQLAEMRVYLAAAEARLPLDGALVKQGFEKIDKEIDLFKRNAHEASGAGITLTIPMLEELERMRRRIVEYERSIDAIANNGSHLQMMVESLGAAVAAQDGRVGGLQQHTAQLQFFIEALRVGQEEDGAPPPPEPHSGARRDTQRAAWEILNWRLPARCLWSCWRLLWRSSET